MPRSFLFGRAWMQWYGGLGIVVLSLALTLRPGITAKSFALTEKEADDLIGGTRAHARRILLLYAALTGAAVLALLIAGVRPSASLLYSLSAVSTGGFAPHYGSLAALPNRVAAVIATGAGVAGALPFAFYIHRFNRTKYSAVNVLQVEALFVAAAVVAVGLWLLMAASPGQSTSEALFHAPMLALSAQTTTGFSSMPPSQLEPPAKLLLVASMLVGGGVGSTAGGVKILRLLILVLLIRILVLRASTARHAVLEPRLAGRRLSQDDVRDALALITLFLMVIFISWIPFVGMGYDPVDSLFDVVSAAGTVGLSTGVASPDLPASLKAILGADMLLGRLEIVAWLVLLYPGTWIGRRLED
jgi:trk system potassium uptake protein TrkH